MSFAVSYLSSDLINLLLYCAQQLGVTLGVGAETVILFAYISAIRDGVVDKQEAQFARAVKKILYVGLMLVLTSGIAITALTLFAGQDVIVYTPAYLFKTLLIVLAFSLPMMIRNYSFPAGILEGLEGATWYALFVVHILAPVALWSQLLTIYIVWTIGFMAVWIGILISMRGKHTPASAMHSVIQTVAKKMPHPASAPKTVPAQRPVVAQTVPVVPIKPPVVEKPLPAPAPLPAVVHEAPAPVPVVVQKPVVPVVEATVPIPPSKPMPVNTLPLQRPPLAPTYAPEEKPKDQDITSNLPRLHVMPKTPEDLKKQTGPFGPFSPARPQA